MTLPEKLMLVALVSKLKAKEYTLHARLRTCLLLVSQKPCSSGMATWCAASGPFIGATQMDARASMTNWKP